MTTSAVTATLASSDAPAMPRRGVHPAYGILVILMLWTLARPYIGLRHDGILYLGQALLQKSPTTMLQDIFFQFGSQDSYSIVSPLLAWLISTWGTAAVQIAVPTLCHVALLAACYLFLRDLPAQERWLGLAALAVMSHVYSGHGVFAFAERFLTGRTFAEPLALWALYLVWRGRVVAGLGVVALAALLHPLVTLPAVVVGWLMMCLRDRRCWWALTALIIPSFLAWKGVAPFAGLLERYDGAWWEAVTNHNGQVLLSLWSMEDWQGLVFDFAVLAAALRALPPRLHPLLRALIVAGLVLLVISAVGADLLRNVLLTQLQVWRVLWLTHLFALLCLPALALWAWRRGAEGRLFALALAVAATAVNARWETGWMLLAWTAIAAWLSASPGRVGALTLRAATATTLTALLGLSIFSVLRIAGLFAGEAAGFDAETVSLLAFTVPAFGMLVAAAALWAREQGGPLSSLAVIAVVALAAYGTTAWDRRDAWTKYVESGLERTHPFTKLIRPTAQVYWHGGLPETWALLQRASYYSGAQAAGLLFNRRTALEFRRRHEAFEPLHFQAQLCQTMAALSGEGQLSQDCYPTDEVMQRICRTSDGPDFMVFQRRAEAGRIAEWTFRPDGGTPRTYHLYDCTQLR